MDFVRHCFQGMHYQHNQHGCPYLHWFYRMACDNYLMQLFQLFETDIKGQFITTELKAHTYYIYQCYFLRNDISYEIIHLILWIKIHAKFHTKFRMKSLTWFFE